MLKTASATRPLPDFAIEAKGLKKIYSGGKVALKGIDLQVPRGSFFGLLGPNGAGKSTFINIMAGLVNKTSGTCAVWGYDIDRETRQARAAIGVVPQELNIDPFFTPFDVLEFQAGLYGVPKIERRTDEILAAMRLSDKARAYARSLSGGMRRRLLVGKAMVHNPPILVLDEPTAGVDVELRQQLWDYVRVLNRRGTTVVLTTHYLEEAEELCDHIAIINHGAVVACDRTAVLLQGLDSKGLSVSIAEAIAEIPPALTRYRVELKPGHRLHFTFRPSETQVAEILSAIAAAGLTIRDLSTDEADLEDLFLQLTRSSGPGIESKAG